ncbi:unnamed protein product [Polarella glacialis]|uniref:HTH La-type RNA-binding domain-containing protein n=1 Tax=Polarella glacialis TaxID=89957 RepID=A0A813KQ01_POLGL|nr:unnamed protein product [Polarella glacialis]
MVSVAAAVTGLSSTPEGVDALTTVEPSSTRMAEVTGLSSISEGVDALTTVEPSSTSMAEVTELSSISEGVDALTTVEPSSTSLAEVTGLSSTPEGVDALTTVEPSSTRMAEVTGLSSISEGVDALTTVEPSSTSMAEVTELSSISEGVDALTTVEPSSTSLAEVTGLSSTPEGVDALTTVEPSSTSMAEVTGLSSIPEGVDALTTFEPSRTSVADSHRLHHLERLRRIRNQVEFYFSDRNLSRDMRFRAELAAPGKDGWVDGCWLLQSPKLLDIGASQEELLSSIAQSDLLEIRQIPAEKHSEKALQAEGMMEPQVSDEEPQFRIRRKGFDASVPCPAAVPQPGREGGLMLIVRCPGATTSKLWPCRSQNLDVDGENEEDLVLEEGQCKDEAMTEDGAELRTLVKAAIRARGAPKDAVCAVSEPNSFREVVVALLPFAGDEGIFGQPQSLPLSRGEEKGTHEAYMWPVFGEHRASALQLLPSRARRELAELQPVARRPRTLPAREPTSHKRTHDGELAAQRENADLDAR